MDPRMDIPRRDMAEGGNLFGIPMLRPFRMCVAPLMCVVAARCDVLISFGG